MSLHFFRMGWLGNQAGMGLVLVGSRVVPGMATGAGKVVGSVESYSKMAALAARVGFVLVCGGRLVCRLSDGVLAFAAGKEESRDAEKEQSGVSVAV